MDKDTSAVVRTVYEAHMGRDQAIVLSSADINAPTIVVQQGIGRWPFDGPITAEMALARRLLAVLNQEGAQP